MRVKTTVKLQNKTRPSFLAGAVIVVCMALPVCLCLSLIALGRSPWGMCVDPVSGRVPPAALKRFLQRFIEATVDQDYEWLATVSNKPALEDLKQVQPKMTKQYEIITVDDFAGAYEVTIHFESGALLHFAFMGHWPECPDPEVTDDELLRYIQFVAVREIDQ